MDDAGDVAAQVRLDAWGNAAIEGDAELVPHRFPGQWHDPETELHYNRHRHYDPATGQYVSRDPIGLRGGLRAYGYVADPTTWSDALGLAGRPAAGAGCGDESDTTRVSRWMSQEEYAAMNRTGLVQESRSGTTHVASPATPDAFEQQAAVGSLHVEFDVPTGALRQTQIGRAHV